MQRRRLADRIASHAILIVDSLSAPATARARDRLIDQGFDDVTILVAGRSRRSVFHPRRKAGERSGPPASGPVTTSPDAPLSLC